MAGIFDFLPNPFKTDAPDPMAGSVAAPPAAPVPGPSGGSGFGSIGDAISNAFSGQGVLGARDGDSAAGASGPGVTKGQERNANMQSLMGVGLMMMAAGSRQSDDSRAQLLSKIPAMMDPSDKINSLVSSRLKLAQLKLAERKQLSEEARGAALSSYLGGSGAGADDPATTAPSGLPAPPAALQPALTPPPNPAAPPMATGTAEMPAGAPLAVTVNPRPATPAPAPVSPPVPSPAVFPAPVAEDEPAPRPTPGMKPATDGALGLPRAPAQSAPIPLSPRPDRREATLLRAMDKDTALKILGDRENLRMNTEYAGKNWFDESTQQVMTPIYKGGQLVRNQPVGPLPEEVRDRDGFREKVRGGRVVERTDIRDLATDEDRKGVNKIMAGRYDTLAKKYEEEIRPAADGYNRLFNLKKSVLDGKAITGTGAEVRRSAINALASAGMVEGDAVNRLVTTNDLEAELKAAAAEFAKKYYGPQISNNDVANAEKLFAAALSNDKAVLAGSLDRLMKRSKETFRQYNEAADDHNGKLDGTKSVGDETKKIIRAKRIDLPKEEAPREEKTIGGVTYFKKDGKWVY